MTRLARHEKIAAALEDAPDDLLASARPLGTGIGGSTWLLRVAGEPVFVKRVALTDIEVRHEGSTADLYGLPAWYHYGVGSAGISAWRELNAHLAATGWVRTGQCENFPLLHHWRVLPGLPRPRADLERDVAFWHGDPGVRRRLAALDGATTDLVLFLEHLPQNLAQWLGGNPGGVAWPTVTSAASPSSWPARVFSTSTRTSRTSSPTGNGSTSPTSGSPRCRTSRSRRPKRRSSPSTPRTTRPTC